MIRSTLLAIAAVAIAPCASATLLVGWHDFDGTTNNEAPDFAASGFSGTLVKNTDSRNLGGDNGGGSGIFYGNSTIPSGSGNDGAVRLLPTPTTGAVFSMTNNSGSAVSLANLFFDATSSSGAGLVLSVAYRIGAAPFANITTYTNLNPSGDTSNPLLQSNFSDLSRSLMGITLNHLQTIEFRFTIPNVTGNGARIDNVAITAIPEPASLLALGCVLGSGLMLRNRRRPALPLAS